jgi:hypothetical protein
MGIEIDFTHGEHGALLRSEESGKVIVFAYLPQGARIGINEALIIEAEYDSVRTHDNAAPLLADRVKTILDCRCIDS